jgi:hypothetical protein
MAPLNLLVAAAMFASIPPSPVPVVVAAVTTDVAASVVADLPSPSPSVASFENACPLPNEVMAILNTLELVGVTRVDRTSKLVSREGVIATAHLPFRSATWAAAAEPQKLPIIYSRILSLDF